MIAADAPLRRGEYVTLDGAGEPIVAFVAMASQNGRSLILMFDAIVFGFVSCAPVLQRDDGQWALLTGQPIELTRYTGDTQR
jgi:hypothetical protein